MSIGRGTADDVFLANRLLATRPGRTRRIHELELGDRDQLLSDVRAVREALEGTSQTPPPNALSEQANMVQVFEEAAGPGGRQINAGVRAVRDAVLSTARVSILIDIRDAENIARENERQAGNFFGALTHASRVDWLDRLIQEASSHEH